MHSSITKFHQAFWWITTPMERLTYGYLFVSHNSIFLTNGISASMHMCVSCKWLIEEINPNMYRFEWSEVYLIIDINCIYSIWVIGGIFNNRYHLYIYIFWHNYATFCSITLYKLSYVPRKPQIHSIWIQFHKVIEICYIYNDKEVQTTSREKETACVHNKINHYSDVTLRPTYSQVQKWTEMYRQISNKCRTKSQNLNLSLLILQFLWNLLKPGVNSTPKM